MIETNVERRTPNVQRRIKELLRSAIRHSVFDVERWAFVFARQLSLDAERVRF
jgi:hypothetical protein